MSQTETSPNPITGEIPMPEPGSPFDPRRFLRKLGGKDYLEVKWRLLWIRTEHPDAIIRTELVRLEDGFALFKAFVAIPGRGEATGWGSETRQDFFDFIEKAETKALGRALAALGYGTQFCDDHSFAAVTVTESERVVDSPVDRRSQGNGQAQAGHQSQSGGALATPAQLKLIYLTATRDLGITEEELEERCQAQYNRLPVHLTKREASEFIDALKAGATQGAQAASAAPQQATTPQEEISEWAHRFVEKAMKGEIRQLRDRDHEIKLMLARLKGAGIPEGKIGLVCKTLHELATCETLGEGTVVSAVMDSRLILALKGANESELSMLKRMAQSQGS